MQPDSHNATNGPWRDLSWGEINFIHTTDTHGWLEGHLNEVNYGADWGDFVSFVKHMRDRAKQLNVDLLTIDTGDLVTGNGLSDATKISGRVSNKIFENLDYDLLTIGNNDLYSIDGAKDIHANFSKLYGDRFLTSNVDIKIDNSFVPIGQRYRHFTTARGLRIVAFGFTLLKFKHDNQIHVKSAKDVIDEQWFKDALDITDVDLYVIIGHADVREPCQSTSTDNPLICMENYIRKKGQHVPIQVFGGHTHRRDFKCFDSGSSGLESGRYADTVGWLALSNVSPTETWNGSRTLPAGITMPSKTCPPATAAIKQTNVPKIDRRYLDFNRWTFAYHALGAPGPDVPATFDTPLGRKVSDDIWKTRNDLNLTTYLGCAPRSYYLWACPEGQPGNIYTMAKDALKTTVKKPSPALPRIIILNNGTFRYDLYQGPFTVGDAFTVVPYADNFQCIHNVPYETASSVVHGLNNGITLSGWRASTQQAKLSQQKLSPRHVLNPNPGHATVDDFGNCATNPDSPECGDDTKHTPIEENIANPKYFQVQDDISDLDVAVDLVFTSHTVKDILNLEVICHKYDSNNVSDYMDKSFTTRDFLQFYAKEKWQNNTTECQIGP
ncbi:hypothetical protein EYZ11_012702 [Aspergillus tanneri]|uniref:Putative 5'-nucleotidase C-terminal domain-containing protein n=1 Tax=Aspergillus tanneri TaxID=1220188 RepID=A0A4S3IZJ9_9EURO|nr:hypothetical protein EYZ11_012702 [Aspergillus tanneri]